MDIKHGTVSDFTQYFFFDSIVASRCPLICFTFALRHYFLMKVSVVTRIIKKMAGERYSFYFSRETKPPFSSA